MGTIGAVVTGGDFQGLGVIRSLGRHGIPVRTVDHELSIARFSRYNKSFCFAPHPSAEADYVHFLEEYARSLGPERWVIFPNNDTVVKILARNKESLGRLYRIPTPGWDVIRHVYNKRNSYKLAAALGIPIPITYYPDSIEDLKALDLEYPVVIKPAIRDFFFSKFHKKAVLVRDRIQLIRYYEAICRFIAPSDILIQEFIAAGPKNLYSFCPLFKDGKAIVSLMARRARQHPMDFGQATTFAETVRIPELEEYGTKFLAAIGYYGLAEVEFMFDPEEGKYKFLEVNARVWGWHTLAAGAGLDLPYILFQDLTGKPYEMPSKTNDAKWIRNITDFPTVLKELLKGRMSFGEYLSSLKGKKQHAVFSVSDPVPLFAELLLAPYLWMKRGF
jgi:D-aspartate ligase